jgi:hypothetical protein
VNVFLFPVNFTVWQERFIGGLERYCACRIFAVTDWWKSPLKAEHAYLLLKTFDPELHYTTTFIITGAQLYSQQLFI